MSCILVLLFLKPVDLILLAATFSLSFMLAEKYIPSFKTHDKEIEPKNKLVSIFVIRRPYGEAKWYEWLSLLATFLLYIILKLTIGK